MERVIKKVWFLLLLIFFSNFKGSIQFDTSGNEDWLIFGKDFFHSNYIDEDIILPLKLKWEYKASSSPGISPLIDSSRIFLPTLDGKIHIVNINDGKRLDRLKFGDGVFGTPAISGKYLYVTKNSLKESLYCYNLQKRKIVWKKKFGRMETSPVVYKKFIIVCNLEGYIICLKKSSSEIIWRYRMGNEIYSTPVIVDDKLLTSNVKGRLILINIMKGIKIWEINLNSIVFSSPVYSNGHIFIGTREGNLMCIDILKGERKWKFKAGGAIYSTPSVNSDCVFFGSNDNFLYALNQQSGKLIWKFKTGAIINSSPLITKNAVIFGSLDHNVYVLDIKDGKLQWKFNTKGRIKSNIISNGKYIFVGYEDKYLAAFSMNK